MRTIWSFDPGVQTGIAAGTYSDGLGYERKEYWQVGNGLDGFLEWINDYTGWDTLNPENYYDPWRSQFSILVSERFVLRNNPFVANTEPLRIEGAMVALGMNPVWQLRTDKALVPDQVLKDNGLWLTGKSVGQKDARDVNDATIHALAYLKKQRHMPTLQKFFPEK